MEGTIAEIRFFAGNFSPRNWAFCNGQILSIAQNTALFSLLGTTYGGNGQTTFSLPDFRSRVAVGAGQGPGLSPFQLGQSGGAETYTIQNSNFPPHTHPVSGTITMKGTAVAGASDSPAGSYPATLAGTPMYATTNNGSALGNMQVALTAGLTGSQQPVNNIQPIIGMNYIICLFGIYPSRN